MWWRLSQAKPGWRREEGGGGGRGGGSVVTGVRVAGSQIPAGLDLLEPHVFADRTRSDGRDHGWRCGYAVVCCLYTPDPENTHPHTYTGTKVFIQFYINSIVATSHTHTHHCTPDYF